MQSVKYQPILFSLLLALVLQLLPWAGFGLKLKPDFMLLVVIYWLLRAPYFCNIGTAWFVGLVMDLVTGGIFGQYGLAYAISAFFAVHYQRRLALFNVWQQSAYVFVLLLLAQTVMFILKMFSGGVNPGWIYFLPSITGILLWQMLIYSRIGIDAPPHKS